MIENAQEACSSGVAVNGVKHASRLLALPVFNVAESFSPDYMHCVLLGVVRQLVNIVFDSSYHSSAFYLGKKIEVADNLMSNMMPPSEIRRTPRAFSERAFWKASEWRAFLLFYSPVIFERLLPKRYFLHWLLLFHAIHLLISRSISTADRFISKVCLFKFVQEFSDLYGVENVGFNVHLLTHLCSSVDNFGPLWATSAFIFEDANRVLLNMCKGTRGIHLQILHRFLAHRKINAEVLGVMEHAPVRVKDLLERLRDHKINIQKACKTAHLTALGAPAKISLNEAEAAAVSETFDHYPSIVNVQRFSRAICKGLLITDADYAERMKRNDSIFCIGEHVYKIL